MSMIRRLANNMREKQRTERAKYVLMLGAGASISSGVTPTLTMMKEIVDKYGDSDGVATLEQRFNRLWSTATRDERDMYLEPYLDREPAEGYQRLARLIKRGYFDVVITFNFDLLLEKSLYAVGVGPNDMHVIIRGEGQDEKMARLLASDERRIKIVKLHGAVQSTRTFLFDPVEMHQYPPPIETLVRDITSRDILVCGYAFNDACVIKAFSDQGGSVHCINPEGPSRFLSGIMRLRNSDDFEIRETFDAFCEELERELEIKADWQPLSYNPFKFLESYEPADAKAFRDRDVEIEQFFNVLSKRPRVIILNGPGRAGKTSLVRAGLYPRLAPIARDEPEGIYVRCQGDLKYSLPEQLSRSRFAKELLRLDPIPAQIDVQEMLERLGKVPDGRRVVLFLDQAERLTAGPPKTKRRDSELRAILKPLLPPTDAEGVTLVFVTNDDDGSNIVRDLCAEADLRVLAVKCYPFSREDVAAIVRRLASDAGLELHARIVDDLAGLYERTATMADSGKHFTLAHIHAVCHLLVQTRSVSYPMFKEIFNSATIAELNEAINVTQYPSFADDRCWPDSAWLRALIKLPLRTRDRMASYIVTNYDDVVPHATRAQ